MPWLNDRWAGLLWRVGLYPLLPAQYRHWSELLSASLPFAMPMAMLLELLPAALQEMPPVTLPEELPVSLVQMPGNREY